MSLLLEGKKYHAPHFVGILGSGMSAIAQFLAWQSLTVSGSDRRVDAGESDGPLANIRHLGCIVSPQNGSGITDTTDLVVVSTAIENSNPDIVAARSKNIPVVHRSDVLASLVSQFKTVAVAGTSGKSTVTALIFHLAEAAGLSPSVITGANLRTLKDQGFVGNAFKGTSDILVIEADESDGTLVKYHPYISLFLNVSKDHNSVEETMAMFAQLRSQSAVAITNGDAPDLASLNADLSFSIKKREGFYAESITQNATSVDVVRGTQNYTLNLPGLHNAQNLLAALCVCTHLGVRENVLCEGVRSFVGLERRFERIEAANGVTIIDDFAHNPDKIRAAITAAQALTQTVHAIFQPHGFSPTRFMRKELVQTFRDTLRDSDTLTLLPIYDAGGTAQRDISSLDLASDLSDAHFRIMTPQERGDSLATIPALAQQGDIVLSMGARDPSLGDFAKDLANAVEESTNEEGGR